MAEDPSQTVTSNTEKTESKDGAAVPESKTQGILREAIRRVMEEIEHHEVQAKKHLQQAADLRKDLRDSIAFLQTEGKKGERNTAPDSDTQHHTTDQEKQPGTRGKSRKKK